MANPLLDMVNAAKKKHARSSGRAIKLKEGKTTIRILQKNDTDKFYAELGVHWIKTSKDGKPIAVVGCESHVHDRECAICTAIDKAAKAATDDATLDVIKEWRVKKSVLLQVVLRSGDTADESKAQILDIPSSLFNDILSMISEYYQDHGNILNPEKGFDFVIERKGKGVDTTYTVMPKPGAKAVSKAALESMIDLDKFIDTEFFRGDEIKALNAMSSMMGFDLGQRALGNARAAGAGLLTSSGAAVAGAEVKNDMNLTLAQSLADASSATATAAATTAAVTPAASAPSAKTSIALEPDADEGITEEDLDEILAGL